jgi:hypothetical protein
MNLSRGQRTARFCTASASTVMQQIELKPLTRARAASPTLNQAYSPALGLDGGLEAVSVGIVLGQERNLLRLQRIGDILGDNAGVEAV